MLDSTSLFAIATNGFLVSTIKQRSVLRSFGMQYLVGSKNLYSILETIFPADPLLLCRKRRKYDHAWTMDILLYPS